MSALLNNEENLFTGNDPNENYDENDSLPFPCPRQIPDIDDSDSEDEFYRDKEQYNLFSPKIKLTHIYYYLIEILMIMILYLSELTNIL